MLDGSALPAVTMRISVTVVGWALMEDCMTTVVVTVCTDPAFAAGATLVTVFVEIDEAGELDAAVAWDVTVARGKVVVMVVVPV